MAHNVPLVVNYLRTHSFGDLFTEHGVNVRPSADGSKFSLNYDQIEAKNGDPIAECCRGLVIRPIKHDAIDSCYNGAVGEVEVLAWPMNRFYNAGTPAGDVVDWSDPGLVVSEKIDGTCCILYWDPQYVQWCVATRSVPDADVVIKNGDVVHGDMTFSKLFWVAYNNTVKDSDGKIIGIENVGLNKEFTYVFELTSRYNRVVVDYDEPKITLLACVILSQVESSTCEAWLPQNFYPDPLLSHVVAVASTRQLNSPILILHRKWKASLHVIQNFDE